MNGSTRGGTAEPVSLYQILRRERGQGISHFPCSADHEQGWQPYPADQYSTESADHIYIHRFVVPETVTRQACCTWSPVHSLQEEQLKLTLLLSCSVSISNKKSTAWGIIE